LLGAVIALGAYIAVFETRPPSPASRVRGNILGDYAELFRHVRFTAFVLQSGFMTSTFLVTATAASSLLKDLLHRPSTEFGIYFLLFPLGFLAGNFITTRIGNRAANETMVLAGSLLSLAAVTTQSSLLLGGLVTPLTLFVPGFFITMAQGISLSYAQAGAMATSPKLAGTAAGVGVFVQNLCAALFAQLYGFVADGTVAPLTETTAITVLCGLVAGVLPFAMARRTRPA
jgi:DHA1 family bicyclomycin/chloramphenicol resistance-like MFS transporter